MEDVVTASNSLAAARAGILMTMQSLSQGGGDRVAVILASGFARAGIPVRIVLMRSAGDAEGELRSLLHPDVTVVAGGPPLRVPFARLLERLRGLRVIRSEINEFRPAIVLGCTDNMAFVTALARRSGESSPLFVQKLTNRLFRPNLDRARRLYRYNLFRFILSRLDLVITLTRGERGDVLEHYPAMMDRVRTLPNPHITDEMLAEPPRRRPGPPRLLTAGRMVPQKRYDLLLRAFAASKHSDARLTLLGDGPLRDSLRTQAQSLRISDRVDMPGFDGNIVPWVQQSDLIVLSSDYEGLPGILVRALACKVPVATTDSFFAARELLDGVPSCAVVPIGDAEALTEAIDHCLAPRERPDDLRKIVEPYRVEASIAAYIAELGRLVDQRKPNRI
jgi:glycosyltransferase involved in cell wall biosynthesis